MNEVAGLNIEGFPTLKFYGKDKSKEPIDFNGGRDADGIVEWLKDHTEYEWVEPQVETAGKETPEELWYFTSWNVIYLNNSLDMRNKNYLLSFYVSNYTD